MNFFPFSFIIKKHKKKKYKLSHMCDVTAKTSTLKMYYILYLANTGRQEILVFY